MGERFKKTVTITAGQQFLGTELAAHPPKPRTMLVVRDVFIKTGSESKSIQVNKAWKNAAGATINSIVESASASTATDFEFAPNLHLLPGEQVQITSQSATAAMNAEIVYEVLDNSPVSRAHDPSYTR